MAAAYGEPGWALGVAANKRLPRNAKVAIRVMVMVILLAHSRGIRAWIGSSRPPDPERVVRGHR
jgi:hypothetical protein